MGFVKAGPSEFLVVGSRGKLTNVGTAVQRYLWPGTVYALIPSSRQETTFELTQESSDGIPLRFKGIAVYRVMEPVAAARFFDFADGEGIHQINTLVNHISLGELRATVAHMTMKECIEQRKTTLSQAVETALRKVTGETAGGEADWGVRIEVVLVSQVYIVDEVLRKQLEAELRNQVWAKSERSTLQTREEVQQAQILSNQRLSDAKMGEEKENLRRKEEIQQVQILSNRRLNDLKIEEEKDNLRRKEEFEQAEIVSRGRIQAAQLEAEREELARTIERVRSQQEAEQARIELEAPAKLALIAHQKSVLQEEESLKQLELRLQELEVSKDMIRESAMQALRKEIIALEQAPALAEAAAKTLNGAKMTWVGVAPQMLEYFGPLLNRAAEVLNRAP